MDDITVLTPGQAAEVMGVSDVTLRRYARAYERVFDDLKLDKGGRLFSGQALDRLSAAKAMQESGQAVSLEQALLMLREGVEAPTPAKVESSEILDLSEARGALAAILRDELRVIIREEVAAAVERLEEQNRVLHEEIMALEPTREVEAVGVADPETLAELEEQRRLNAYLKGEIVRRDLEAAEKVSKPWWKWWG